MTGSVLAVVALAAANVLVAALLSPFAEGVMRKIRAFFHSRQGPPLLQPYYDLLKLLGKEDLRPTASRCYAALPALGLGAVLTLATLVPMGAPPPLGFAGDAIAVIYIAAAGAVLLMLTAFASRSPYASVGGSREMMLLLSVEPTMAVALVIAAVKAGTLTVGGMLAWHAEHGPAISMAIAAIGFLIAIQAQAGRLPFDIPEAEQELMGGPLVEQSGPRLALLRWALWAKQLVLALLLVEVFVPWPRTAWFVVNLPLALLKAMAVLALVAVIDVVTPRLRVEQAMTFYLRVAFACVAGLAFALIGM